MNHLRAFEQRLESEGLAVKDGVINDGQIHRFHIAGDKPCTKNGWYVMHTKRISFGAFGNWRTGYSASWREDFSDELTATERWELQTQMAQVREQQRELHATQQDETAARAKRMWDQAQPADPQHPYLRRKGILPLNLRQLGDRLLVPLINAEQELRNLQQIHPDGEKRFLSGGQVKGCFCLIDAPDLRKVLVCEGFATGATLFKATGHSVMCAMNAGNLQSVALIANSAVALIPRSHVVICADNDHRTPGNPGITQARKAAEASGADYTWPSICGDQCECSDFNDTFVCPRKQEAE
ncbi:toprim domain-containing protein [Marinobacterium sp. BA1]|uniref:toprim domain-containing protein n=1 Tax=Marinobacterium sp. BA1 TaxID=3138931 RepID=UPI0032E76AC6